MVFARPDSGEREYGKIRTGQNVENPLKSSVERSMKDPVSTTYKATTGLTGATTTGLVIAAAAGATIAGGAVVGPAAGAAVVGGIASHRMATRGSAFKSTRSTDQRIRENKLAFARAVVEAMNLDGNKDLASRGYKKNWRGVNNQEDLLIENIAKNLVNEEIFSYSKTQKRAQIRKIDTDITQEANNINQARIGLKKEAAIAYATGLDNTTKLLATNSEGTLAEGAFTDRVRTMDDLSDLFHSNEDRNAFLIDLHDLVTDNTLTDKKLDTEWLKLLKRYEIGDTDAVKRVAGVAKNILEHHQNSAALDPGAFDRQIVTEAMNEICNLQDEKQKIQEEIDAAPGSDTNPLIRIESGKQSRDASLYRAEAEDYIARQLTPSKIKNDEHIVNIVNKMATVLSDNLGKLLNDNTAGGTPQLDRNNKIDVNISALSNKHLVNNITNKILDREYKSPELKNNRHALEVADARSGKLRKVKPILNKLRIPNNGRKKLGSDKISLEDSIALNYASGMIVGSKMLAGSGLYANIDEQGPHRPNKGTGLRRHDADVVDTTVRWGFQDTAGGSSRQTNARGSTRSQMEAHLTRALLKTDKNISDILTKEMIIGTRDIDSKESSRNNESLQGIGLRGLYKIEDQRLFDEDNLTGSSQKKKHFKVGRLSPKKDQHIFKDSSFIEYFKKVLGLTDAPPAAATPARTRGSGPTHPPSGGGGTPSVTKSFFGPIDDDSTVATDTDTFSLGEDKRRSGSSPDEDRGGDDTSPTRGGWFQGAGRLLGGLFRRTNKGEPDAEKKDWDEETATSKVSALTEEVFPTDTARREKADLDRAAAAEVVELNIPTKGETIALMPAEGKGIRFTDIDNIKYAHYETTDRTKSPLSEGKGYSFGGMDGFKIGRDRTGGLVLTNGTGEGDRNYDIKQNGDTLLTINTNDGAFTGITLGEGVDLEQVKSLFDDKITVNTARATITYSFKDLEIPQPPQTIEIEAANDDLGLGEEAQKDVKSAVLGLKQNMPQGKKSFNLFGQSDQKSSVGLNKIFRKRKENRNIGRN